MHYSTEQTEERFKIAPQMTDISSFCPRRSVEHARLIVSLISKTSDVERKLNHELELTLD